MKNPDLNQDEKEGVRARLERTQKLLVALSSLYGETSFNEIESSINQFILCITTKDVMEPVKVQFS